MKHNYYYAVGDTVQFKGHEWIIKSRYGNNPEPGYRIYRPEEPDNVITVDECSIVKEIKTKPAQVITHSTPKMQYLDYLNTVTSNCRNLMKIGRCLNLLAFNNELAPAFGRETEIEKVAKILLRRTKPNPVLVGPAGVGKTAIVEGYVQSIVDREKKKSGNFSGPVVFEISISSFVGGTKYRGEFEERFERVIKEAKQENVVLFIDEIHSLIGAGGSGLDDSETADQFIKPYLARGEIKVIGATTTEEFEKYIKKDKALARRFHEISVKEIENKVFVAKAILNNYSEYFGIDTSEIHVEGFIDLLTEKKMGVFPDNFIDLVDETLATAKYEGKTKIDNWDMQTVFDSKKSSMKIKSIGF